MSRTRPKKVITVSQKMLNFANLERVDSAQQINEILRPAHPVLWNSADENDKRGLAALDVLREETCLRLLVLSSGGKARRKEILGKLVREARAASAQGNVQGVPVGPLPCLPEIATDKRGVKILNYWLISGAHAAVIFGLIALFVDGVLDRLLRCKQCQRFYLKTHTLRVACSLDCRRALRIEDVARNVKKLRQKASKPRKRRKK